MSNLNTKAVEIALKRATGSNQRVLPGNINNIIQAEYASKYLELIGAYPTKDNCDFLLDNLPVSEALIVPLWSREQIIVVPGMTEKEAEATNLFSIPKDHTKEKKEETKEDSETTAPTGILGNKNGEPTPLQSGNRKLSWSTVDSVDKIGRLAFNLGSDDVRLESFKKLVIPLSFTEEQLTKPVSIFCSNIVDFIPRIRLDKTGKMYDNLLRLLSLSSSLKLFSLMTHYVYWNIIHPFARNALISVGKLPQNDPSISMNRFDVEKISLTGTSLTASAYQDIDLMSETSLNDREKEILFVQLESCLLKIHKGIGYSKQALQSAYQALVNCCHFVVDELLSAVYPWMSNINAFRSNNPNKDFASEEILKNVKLQLRRFIHQCISDIIDPSRIYTSAFITTSKIPGAKPPKTSKGGFYCTSAATKAIFGDSKNSDTRRMLNSYTSRPYTAIPGAVDPALANTSTIPELGIDPLLLNKFLDDDESSLSSMSVRSLDDIPLLDFDVDEEGYTDNNNNNNNNTKIPRSFSANNFMNSPIRTPNQLPPVSRTMSSPMPAKDGTPSKFTSEIHQIINNSKNMRSRLDLDQCFTNQKRDVIHDVEMKKEVLRKKLDQSYSKNNKIPAVNYKNLFDNDFSNDKSNKSCKSSKSSKIIEKKKKKNDEIKCLDFEEVLDTGCQSEVASLYDNSVGGDSVASNTSMAQNKNAQIQLSMKSKNNLMNLLLERTGSLYSERNIGAQFGKTLGATHRQSLLFDKNEKNKYFYIKTASKHQDVTAYYHST
jgi:hypothetical protein